MARYGFRELVIDSRTGLNPRTNFTLGEGNNYYITIKDIHDGRVVITDKTDRVNDEAIAIIKKRSRIKNGDILFTSIGRIGETAIVENKDDTWDVNESVFVFTLNRQIISPEYLCIMFQSDDVQDRLLRDSSGSTFKSIKMNQLEKMTFDVPDIRTQQKVSSSLQKVTYLISLRKQQIAKLDELVKARFVEMFDGIHDSTKYPYVTIDSFTSVMSGGTPDRGIPEYWTSGTIRWVKTTELQNCVIHDTEEHITQEGLDNSSAKLIPAGSILIAMYGQGKTRGMTGFLAVESTTNQACACILPSSAVNQTYLWQYMILSYDKLRDMAKGGNQPNLNAGIIKAFPVLMPPMELQNQFAAFVAQTDQQKSTIQHSLAQLELLKKALMQKYFG